jgi:nicotinamidase/pyrazinamidase
VKVQPDDALIVVDVQVDFCPGGALPVSEGDRIVPGINRILPLFRRVVYTRDWHPANHCSFSAKPEFVDGSWPLHCVQDTPGATFHPDLVVPRDAWIVGKAMDPARESYSDFDGTNLARQLRDAGVTRVFVCGLATDYCVKATAIDARTADFETVLLEDLCRGVDVPSGTATAAIDAMQEAGVALCRSGDLR